MVWMVFLHVIAVFMRALEGATILKCPGLVHAVSVVVAVVVIVVDGRWYCRWPLVCQP